MKKSTENQIQYNAVVYTDGSAGPSNPGFYGSGGHGYLYPLTMLGKKTNNRHRKYIPSTLGYIFVDELPKYREYNEEETATLREEFKIDNLLKFAPVTPSHYINAIYSYKGMGTNNVGEILGFVNVVKDLLKIEDLDIVNILIKADSTYIIHIFNTIMNTEEHIWRSKVETNINYWYEVKEVIDAVKARNITIDIHKVEGHSSSLGNHLADRMAYLARVESMRGEDGHKFSLIDSKGYWESNKDRHPLLRFKQIYFNSPNREVNGEYIYNILDYDKDSEVGGKTQEATFGMVILKDAPKIIEDAVLTYHKRLGTLSLASTVDLNQLYSSHNANYYDIFGNIIYTFNKRNTILSTLGETPLVYSITPPGLLNQAMDKMIILYSIMKDYKEYKEGKPTSRSYYDITNLVYNSDGKKMDTILPREIATIKVDINYKDTPFIVPIHLGVDCPDRNQFKKMENDGTKVHIAVTQLSETVISYFIIIDMENTGDMGIFCNYYSNLLIRDKKRSKL